VGWETKGQRNQRSRPFTFSRGIGLPGRVWASGKLAWIPDVTQDANCSRAPFRPVVLDPAWRTPTVTERATAVYEERPLPTSTLDPVPRHPPPSTPPREGRAGGLAQGAYLASVNFYGLV